MNARAFFKTLNFVVISISVVIGLSAIFLVERIVPAIDDIVKENAFSVDSTINMLDTISANDHHQKSEDLEQRFWTAYQAAEQNISIDEEKLILSDIKNLAILYWSGNSDEMQRQSLSTNITALAKLNLNDMKIKDARAQFMGLTGAWAMGLLLFLSIGIQLYFRNKTMSNIIVPVEDLFSVLDSYNCGNHQRRYLVSSEAVDDIKKIGQAINDQLDRLESHNN